MRISHAYCAYAVRVRALRKLLSVTVLCPAVALVARRQRYEKKIKITPYTWGISIGGQMPYEVEKISQTMSPDGLGGLVIAVG